MKLTLPEAKETQAEIVIAGKSTFIDLFDFEQMLMETSKETKELGLDSEFEYIDLFSQKAKKQWDLELSRATTLQLLNFLTDQLEDFKKKLLTNLNSQDSTTSQLKSQKKTKKSSSKSSRQQKKT